MKKYEKHRDIFQGLKIKDLSKLNIFNDIIVIQQIFIDCLLGVLLLAIAVKKTDEGPTFLGLI